MKKDPRFKNQEYRPEQVRGHYDGARRNRNSFLYDSDGFISDQEVSEALKIADQYLRLIEQYLYS